MVRKRSQWLEAPEARESGAVICVDDPVAGATIMPGAGFDLSETATAVDPRHPSTRTTTTCSVSFPTSAGRRRP